MVTRAWTGDPPGRKEEGGKEKRNGRDLRGRIRKGVVVFRQQAFETGMFGGASMVVQVGVCVCVCERVLWQEAQLQTLDWFSLFGWLSVVMCRVVVWWSGGVNGKGCFLVCFGFVFFSFRKAGG